MIQKILSALAILWQWPLFLLLIFRQKVQHNPESLKWNEDVRYFNLSFFCLLRQRPWYKALLYRRLGVGGSFETFIW